MIKPLTVSTWYLVPPRIAPYSFPSPVSQGSRVQVVCSVEQGDIEETNLTVTWLKDMDPIGQGGGGSANAISSATTNAKVMRVDAYSTILIIERVDWERDSGNYTCRISNSVDEVHKTNELVVRGTKLKHNFLSMTRSCLSFCTALHPQHRRFLNFLRT